MIRLRRAALPASVLSAALLCSFAHAASARPLTNLPALMSLRAANSLPAGLPIPLPAQSAGGKIKHIVIIMQENRSFDDLFQGYPGADTQSFGYDSNGKQVPLQPVPFEATYDIDHDIYDFFTAYDNGKMDGFNNEGAGLRPRFSNEPQYGYVPASETVPYFNMAQQYVLADRMFTSHIDDSYISHQYIIAAQANHAAFFPSSFWGCDGGNQDVIPTLLPNRAIGRNEHTCWDGNTLGDELDKAHHSWRFYTSRINQDGGLWSAYQAIRHIRFGPDWKKDVIQPQNRVLTDIANGKLANVTWVMPTCPNSDHSGCGSNTGPSWVASIVNAVGQSRFWDSSAIFITWDEWGGWYDHVPPPYVDYDGLGFRVPLLVISPYAKQNYVSHVQYEQGSILRFAEDQFGLGRLADSDKRSNSPAVDCFDFSQPARPFLPFASPRSRSYFVNQPPDGRSPDRE